MTNEQVERAIEFLIEHHSKVSADIERHSEQIGRLSEEVGKITGVVLSLAETVEGVQQEAEANRLETRYAIDKLIVANEATRKMTEEIARLAIATSQGVSRLEDSSPS